MVQKILHHAPALSVFLHVFVQECMAWHPRKMRRKKQKCRLYLHKSYTLRPYPTPYPSPEIVSKYRESDTLVQEMQEIFKNFFCRGGERESGAAVWKQLNIGLLWTKVRMFDFKSTDVFIEEVRCFCFPERELHYLNVSLSKGRCHRSPYKHESYPLEHDFFYPCLLCGDYSFRRGLRRCLFGKKACKILDAWNG